TRPPAARIQVRPAVEVRIESGRIVLRVDAEWLELSGHRPIAEAELPRGMHVTEVTGDGLSAWTVSTDGRLHLIWSRTGELLRRRLQISGWIPVREDPMTISTNAHEISCPWVGWVGAESRTGTLAVISNARPEIRGATGLVAMTPDS